MALRGRVEAVGASGSGGLPGVASVAVAVLCNAVGNGVVVAAWCGVLAAAGTPLGGRAAAWIWSVSQLARYALGAAQVGGRAVLGRRYGLGATAGAVTTLVEVAWQTAITATLVLATAPWWLPGAADLAWLAWAGALPAAALVAGLIRPDLLLRGVAAVLRWGPLRRVADDRMASAPGRVQLDHAGDRMASALGRVQLDRAGVARVTGLYALNSALRLAGFLTLFTAVGGDLHAGGLRAVGAYAIGQVVGRLAVFAPGGLGPREGATALAVAPAVGGGPALVLVAAVRLAELLGEAAFAAVARAARPHIARP